MDKNSSQNYESVRIENVIKRLKIPLRLYKVSAFMTRYISAYKDLKPYSSTNCVWGVN